MLSSQLEYSLSIGGAVSNVDILLYLVHAKQACERELVFRRRIFTLLLRADVLPVVHRIQQKVLYADLGKREQSSVRALAEERRARKPEESISGCSRYLLQE